MNWDYIIIGAGHNGLICANYLSRANKKVLVLEKRASVGGAAATEEIFPGYHFSRFSYVFSIFRQKIIEELFPKNWRDELILYRTEPSAFIPTLNNNYLLLSNDKQQTYKNIEQFVDENEAQNYSKLYSLLNDTAHIIDPLLDRPVVNSIIDVIKILPSLKRPKNHSIAEIIQFLNSSSANVLDQWLRNDNLKAALSYAGTVGQLQSPFTAGSAFLQLHHVANTITTDGIKYRYYPRGGMGAISNYLAKLATEQGVTIETDKGIKEIQIQDNKACGVILENDKIISAKNIISNCTYANTFDNFVAKEHKKALPNDYQRGLKSISYKTNCCKINLVLKDIPSFTCLKDVIPVDASFETRKKLASKIMHNTLFTGSSMQILHDNYIAAENGDICAKPTIQMLMPSLMDDSLTPKCSTDIVTLLFVQYTPYKIEGGWSADNRQKFIDNTIKHIEDYAPKFGQLIKHIDAIFPPDIENILGLTGGNIFQGAMDLDNLYVSRPMPNYTQYQTPIKNLFSCSSANHPGGGVCGGPGRNSAKIILRNS